VIRDEDGRERWKNSSVFIFLVKTGSDLKKTKLKTGEDIRKYGNRQIRDEELEN